MQEEKLYQKVKNIAYRTICKYVSNQEDREDLAQTVLIKYYLHEDKLQKENLNNWIITVAKNASIDYNKSKKHQISQKTLNFDDLENIITESFLTKDKKKQEVKSLDDILKDYSKIISQPERQLLERYIKSGFKIKKLAYRRRTSFAAIKKRIYRLKADIRAEYNKQQGIIASRLIVGAKLHENLQNFLKKFKNALETNSLEKMKLYFRECEISHKIPDIKIKEILDYDIKLLDNKKYKLFVNYLNLEGIFSSFITIFEIYNENSIKIVEFPKPPQKIIKVNLDKTIIETIMQTQKDGTLKMKREEIMEFLKGKGKMKEIYNQDKSEE
jgi:RNA polymerase sigma factor (sigma-70 family)